MKNEIKNGTVKITLPDYNTLVKYKKVVEENHCYLYDYTHDGEIWMLRKFNDAEELLLKEIERLESKVHEAEKTATIAKKDRQEIVDKFKTRIWVEKNCNFIVLIAEIVIFIGIVAALSMMYLG